MSFSEQLLKEARRGELFLDCHEMELKQNQEESPGFARGPGYIKQTEHGWFEFKIYAKDQQHLDSSFYSSDARPKPGELFQHEHYYTLTFIDSSANRWTAGRIIPQISLSCHFSPPTVVVTGTFFEMQSSHEDDFTLVNHHLNMAIYAKVEVPFNTGTSYYESVGRGDIELRRGSLDKAVFQAAGCEFSVREEQDVLLISVKSSNPIPPDFETRIIEGLLFVLGQPLTWNESKRHHGNIEYLRLRSRISIESKVRMKAPIFVQQDSTFRRVWVLFDLYLKFIGEIEGAGFHPCSSYLFSVSQASATSADSFALALAIAVEGLVNTLYKHLGEVGPRFVDAVDALADHVLSWPALKFWVKAAGLDPERLPGLIGNLKNVSPQARMHILVKSGDLIKEHVRIWKRVRTRKAHALDDPASQRMQELLRDIDALIVLVYHLIFNSIGYDGIYTDYSTVGYGAVPK